MKFNDNLLKMRKENNFSQEQLADKMSVTRQTISKWENGTAMPDLKKITELAELFGVSMDELLGTPAQKPANEKADFHDDFLKEIEQQILELNDNSETQRNKLKKLTGVVVILILLCIILFISFKVSFNDRINNLENQLNALQSQVDMLRTSGNNASDSVYIDNFNDFKITKVYDDKPYLVEIELKYTPDEYSKNAKVFYCVPQPDGSAKKLETLGEDGVFTLKTDYDLRTENNAEFSIIVEEDDKVERFRLYDVNVFQKYRQFTFGSSYSTSCYNGELNIDVDEYNNEVGNGLYWTQGAAAEIKSAVLVVENGGAVIYEEKLIITKRNKTDEYGSEITVGYIDMFDKKISGVSTVNNLEIYFLLEDKNGVVYKCYPNYDWNENGGIELSDYRAEMYFNIDGKNLKAYAYCE